MWTNLINAIIAVIRTNGNKEITGQLLQDSLIAIINNVGSDYGFLGVAVPTTDPGDYGGDIAYFATEPGTYINLGNVVVQAIGLYLILRTGEDWTVQNLVSSNTDEQLAETIRKTLNPSSYVSYLSESTPFTTALIPANTLTKILIPTTVKSIQDFGIIDKGGGDFAIQYQGSTARTFKIFMSTGMATGTNNVIFDIYMYRNGVMEPGIGISRKVGTGADVGAIATLGEFVAQPNDTLEVYVKLSLASTVTFLRTSIIFTEKN